MYKSFGFLKNGDDKEFLEVKDVLLNREELMNHGRELGRLHSIGKKRDVKKLLLHRLNKNFNILENIYLNFNKDINEEKALPKAAEWLLDNFYIIELQYKKVRKSIENEKKLVLTTLKSGVFKGYPRVYAIALDLVAHSEGIITEETLIGFLDAYQEEEVLTIKEVSSLSLMFNIALIEYIKAIVILIEETQKSWREAEKVDLSTILEEEVINEIFKSDTSYLEHLLRRIKKEREDYNYIINFIDKKLNYLGANINSVLEKEYKKQGSIKNSIGNGITSLRSISNLKWEDIFERLCFVEKILKKDPANIYYAMDSESRSYYRYEVEKLAKKLKTEEAYIANKALEFAKGQFREGIKDKSCHIGYYIVDKGRDKIFKSLGAVNTKDGIYYKNSKVYISPIILLTLFIVLLFSRYAFFRSNLFTSIIVGVVTFIPASSIATTLINFIYSKIINPVLIPKLELRDGIPEEASTIVVIPTLLFNEERVEELCQNLETYYLANKEENLYFAIAGDFKDGPNEVEEEDKNIIKKGLECIEKLNQKYSTKENIFYFFHRKRIYSHNEEKWMGWERKRGALVEFNDLLLGNNNTTFKIISSDISVLRENVKYVITLDGDTQLPLETAKKLIGTMYHPLNRPVLDDENNIVKEGYGLIQPRIIIDMENANKSLFTRIYAGQGGIDPYTTAVSDIYQDLFGEGIFTGKGIYDLKVFQKCLKETIPENSILSHDLLEGSFIRVGLATDIELVDGYPEKYNSYIMRQHRWVRGDWQLIRWLRSKNNPLSSLSRWKILDNLRRSLLTINLTLLIILGLCFFPGNLRVWIGFAVLTNLFTLILSIIDIIFFKDVKFDRLKLNGNIISGPKGYFYQGLLDFIFLPYEGYMMADAIIRTCYRVFISKKNLLQWTTAFEVEKELGNNLKSYFRRMAKEIVIAFSTIFLTYFFHYENLISAIAISGLWIISPYFAYLISKEDIEDLVLNRENVKTLRRIGRKTWDYYAEYTNKENNFLPPDNYQEYPYNGVAFRTSPTNIGFYLMAILSARDFGYITTTEMKNLIKKTLDTIGKLEKWNGHLYNWYTTTTLEPLRPYFVSTVDSGNFVSYLITVKEGLIEYINKPLVDKNFVSGLKDTIELIEEEEIKLILMESLNKVEDLSIKDLQNIILKIKTRKQNKKDKWIDKTIDQLYKIEEEYINYLPSETTYDKLKRLDLKVDYSLSLLELEDYYDKILTVIEDENLEKEINRLNKNVKELVLEIEKNIYIIEKLIKETKFTPLYDFKKDLFSIGYNVQDKLLLNSYYDLLASEARITSYIAVCRREVPKKHWFKLGRPLVIKKGYRSLASWSGTMFEYLMPSIVMKNFKNTLIDESYKTVIGVQRDYCKDKNIPWGISESGFFAFDSSLNYQYKAFGVPYLGFKRGLKEDLVISPYATFLALPFESKEVLENINRLIEEGLEGKYGFYEAIDYTKKRLPIGMDKAIVKSYMTHHQGMIFTTINNVLNRNILINRFHNCPEMKCGELLLQEKMPTNIIVAKEKENLLELRQEEIKDEILVIREFGLESLNSIKCHILSSGNYSTMITNRGEGYSKKGDNFVNRWRKDILSRSSGIFIYIKDLKTNNFWSTTYKPTIKEPDDYKVEFLNDKAIFYRTDGHIETKMELVLLSEEEGEIRKITITNNSEEEILIDVTSYFEVVGDRYESDLAHEVFNNLFVRTTKLEDYEAVLAHRRGKEGEDEIWITHSIKDFDGNSSSFQCETKRVNFIGRNRDLTNPIGLEKGLSNTTGIVLDPILSLNKRLRIKGGESKEVYFVTSINDRKKDAYDVIKRYQDKISFSRAFNLAHTRSQTEISYLNFKPSQIKLFDNILSNLLFLNAENKNKYSAILKDNIKGQEGLWAYGVSGDNPIVLATIKTMEGIDNLKEILKAHEYWTYKGLKVDLIVLNKDDSAYYQPLLERINETVYEYRGNVVEMSGGVYVRNENNMPIEDVVMFYTWANLIVDCESGFTNEKKEELNIPYKKYNNNPKEYPRIETELELKEFNGYGGYSSDGKEYIIKLTENINTPLPWVNIVANKKFGFLVSEQGSSFSWAYNSRENKLTPWFNDPVNNISEEIIYIRDDDTGELWSITPWPIRNKETYLISHGLGYTKFDYTGKGLEQSLSMFVPIDENIKVNLIKLKNNFDEDRRLTIFYYIRPVLGVTDEETEMFIETDFNEEIFIARNSTNEEFKNSTLFIGTSENIKSYTGDRIEFLGLNSTFKYPEGIKRERLSEKTGLGLNPCCAIEIPIVLKSGEEKEMTILLGENREEEKGKKIINKYSNVEVAKNQLENIKYYWENILGIIKIQTPDESMNLIMNYWLMYQTIVSRLWGRAGFYQVGGAFGARDQIQDSVNSIYFLPEQTKKQILNNCKHQFIEGDIQHWWHPAPDREVHKGIRSKYTDDRLWLPYGVSKYIEVTGDYSILREEVPFIESNILEKDEQERYEIPKLSTEVGTVYEHCIRAIDISLKFGERGLPLIGSGDWNDGMNRVGYKGKGESIWLGWFLGTVLQRFIPICEEIGDMDRKEKYEKIVKSLEEAIEKNGWDGEWYLRAYFDDGTPLGSKKNEECMIDSIAQSWSVISALGKEEKMKIAMNSVEKYLVDEEEGIIKLLSPPFDESHLDPGYIKSYVPGVRENGGQYTHAATWVIKAFALLGKGDKAHKLFNLINPINHTRSTIECAKYKVEPYVIAADVYTTSSLVGRGGWTWYTGSSGWMYRVGLENILGFKKEGNKLFINPCIPKKWENFSIKYRFLDTVYNIEIKNPYSKNTGVNTIKLDGKLIETEYIPLTNDKSQHFIEVILGSYKENLIS